MKVLDRPEGNPELYDQQTILQELTRCTNRQHGLFYFVWNYCYIYDNVTRGWVPFKLWPFQMKVLQLILDNQYSIILKTRQVGVTWLVLAYELWDSLFFPETLCLNFSRRELEAIELVDFRIKGMYKSLPSWMRAEIVDKDTKTEFELSIGSRFRASSSGGSDSYAASFAFIDEAELVEETTPLAKLMTALEPTVGTAGGKMVMVSRSDKRRPNSTFKQTFRAALAGKSMYKALFIPWYDHPRRDQKWYDVRRQNAEETDTLDELFEQYPATVEEALMANMRQKRYSEKWIKQCFFPDERMDFTEIEDFPSLPVESTFLYREREEGKRYVIVADPAEGNPSSDDSGLMVFDTTNHEQVLVFRGKLEPDIFAHYLNLVSIYYNRAAAFVERNNHGHTVISYLRNNTNCPVIEGRDSTSARPKFGFPTTKVSKVAATDAVAEALRGKKLVLHDIETTVQLSDINGSTLSASEGNHDDLASCIFLYCILDQQWVPTFSFDVLM